MRKGGPGLAAALGKHGVPPDPCSNCPAFTSALGPPASTPDPPPAVVRPNYGHAANKIPDAGQRRHEPKDAGPAARFYGTTPQPGSTYSLPVLQHAGAFAQQPRGHFNGLTGFVPANQPWPRMHLQGPAVPHIQPACPRMHPGSATQDVALQWPRMPRPGHLPRGPEPWPPGCALPSLHPGLLVDGHHMLQKVQPPQGVPVPHPLGHTAASMGSELPEPGQQGLGAQVSPLPDPAGLSVSDKVCKAKSSLSTPPPPRPSAACPVNAQDLEAFLASKAASAGEDAQASESTKTPSSENNSGRLLLMLLKGSRGEGTGALPEVNDERWHKSRWEPLLQPFADSSDPKRFISAEHFAPGRGLCVSGSGALPCVLQDLPRSDLLVMYKPSGWATCSTPQWEGVHGNLIRYVWKKHAHGPVAAPCHRLDRGTSGIVIVAKSRTALRHVCLQISSRSLVKQYIGLCRGIVDPPQGALSIPLAISSADKPLGACATAGRMAVTRYRVLGYFRQETAGGSTEYSLVQVQIDHGRQHQIRLHMASMGHPIVCDVKYSSSHFKEDSQVTGGRLFLHAAFLRGTLPPDGIAPLSIACRLPRQLRECLTSMQRLRSLEETLSLEATELCDCLLMPDPEVVQKCDPGLEVKALSKASSEKETEDPETEDLETEETEETEAEEAEEVAGVLSKRNLETEMLAQMNELLNTEAEPGDRSETDSESEANNELPEEVDEETNLDGVDSVAETDSGFGPMSLHSQFVRCKVCGEQEKVEKVEFPALRLRLSCRSVATWNAQVLKLFHSEEDREQGQHLQTRNSERWSNEDWTNEWSNRWWQQPCPEAWEWEWSSKSHPAPAKSGAGGGRSLGAGQPGPPQRDSRRRAEKQNVEVQMRKELYAHLKEHGMRHVPGPSVAGLFAYRYNQFLRKDGRRNDGSVRAWISSQPGVEVEAMGGNQWPWTSDSDALRCASSCKLAILLMSNYD
ncbi:rluC [Symbiodinium necroappetens]|uniref:RluC protein n=1 Tax=Symbiodinium necroappetens TaxID=1628268 RepID=A0A812N9J3_9DINO|nr:rluC [Symbiodinium necroappetens]